MILHSLSRNVDAPTYLTVLLFSGHFEKWTGLTNTNNHQRILLLKLYFIPSFGSEEDFQIFRNLIQSEVLAAILEGRQAKVTENTIVAELVDHTRSIMKDDI